MLETCKFPGRGYACGKCLPCLVRKRSAITARGVMEAQYYPLEQTVFVTLSYNEDFLPTVVVEDPLTGEQIEHMTLCKKDLQDFLRRLNYHHEKATGRKVRYLGAGEYGGQFGRPHYHLILFGITHQLAYELCYRAWSVPIREGLQSIHESRVKVKRPNSPKYVYDFVEVAAGKTRHQKGFITFGEANPLSVAYTASYTISGITEKSRRPEGVEKEFALWSTVPKGLGAEYIYEYGRQLAENYHIAGLPSTYAPGKAAIGLPNSIQLPTPKGLKPYALDRTMRKHMLKGMGVDYDSEEAKEARRYAFETRQEAIELPGDPLGLYTEAVTMAKKGAGRAAKMVRRQRAMRKEGPH